MMISMWTWNKIVVYIICGQWLMYVLASGIFDDERIRKLFYKTCNDPADRRISLPRVFEHQHHLYFLLAGH